MQVSWYNLNLALFGILAGVASGLGKQWDLGFINTFFLMIFGLPVIYYTTIIREGGGLDDVWFWMNICYAGINGSLIAVFVSADWYKIRDEILAEVEDEGGNKSNGARPSEETPLL